jgi:MFS family permease
MHLPAEPLTDTHLPSSEIALPSPHLTAAPLTPVTTVATPDLLTFDLNLARASLLIDIASYVLMPLAPTGALFGAAAALHSFGTGFTPAVRSIALELFVRRGGTESGKLFGALSVLQALGGSVFGPAIYGTVYASTVGWFPQAVFFVTAGAVIVSFVAVGLVRFPDRTVRHTNVED